MDKLRMKSLDAVEGNVAKIATLFPQCVTERLNKDGKPELAIDFDKLRAELSAEVLDTGEERYQFTWPDKRAASRLANIPTDKTLRPDVDASEDFWNTQNLYIEGDNLDVLKVLRENYLGKVKMIYIDPPYNTGNDFVYNDDFNVEKETEESRNGLFDESGMQTLSRFERNTSANGRFHTDWLNMIYPRLKVARDLLAEDGVVFISIDDSEYYNMLKVCNEIFGEQNYVTSFSWVNSLKEELTDDTKFAGSNLGTIKKSHEYVLVYARYAFKMALDFSSNPYIEKLITNGGNAIQKLEIPKGLKCIKQITTVIKGHVGGSSDYYDILTPEGMIVENGVLQNNVTIEGPLRNPVMLTKFFSGEKIVDKKGQELVEVYFNENGMLQTKKLRTGNTISTVLVGKGTTKNGTLLLKEMFGDTVFDYSKPIELINYLISKHTEDEFILLDFFSGSATTAHSVFLANALTDRRIKYILVQIQEIIDPAKVTNPASKKIAEAAIRYLDKKQKPHLITELAKERIRLATKKIKKDLGITTTNIDFGFRVLKLDSSNMEDVFYTPEEFNEANLFNTIDNVKPDRTPLDLLFQVMPELDIELSAKIEEKEVNGKKVFFVDDTYLIATFDTEVNESTVTEIAKMKPQYFVMRDASAANDNVLDNFEQIFRHYSPDTICKVL